MTLIQRGGFYCVVVIVSKYPAGSCLHRGLCKLISLGEIHVKTRTRRQLLGQKLYMGPPELKKKIAIYSTTIYVLQFNICVISWLTCFLVRQDVFWNILCTGLHDYCLR